VLLRFVLPESLFLNETNAVVEARSKTGTLFSGLLVKTYTQLVCFFCESKLLQCTTAQETGAPITKSNDLVCMVFVGENIAEAYSVG